MAKLRALISGAGIAGTALAFWLSKLGHEVTVVERSSSLRDSGLQVDLRGPGIEVLRKMGVEEAFRALSISEQGLQMVDSKGRIWGTMGVNKSGKGLQSFTTDFEIMRGDLCKLLHDLTEDKVEYRFGLSISEINQTDEHAQVKFSDNSTGTFDLVVGADGSRSRTRDMILSPGAKNPFNPLGIFAAYFTIPKSVKNGEDRIARFMVSTDNRGIMTRRGHDDKYQVYLFCKSKSSSYFQNGNQRDYEEIKTGFAEVFCDVGWKSREIIEGMKKSKDFYCDYIGLVSMEKWSRGRVALVGDAAYCPTSMTGMGTTCGMVGSYVLAGEIDKHCGRGAKTEAKDSVSKENIEAAFQGYEERMRPWIDTVQKGIAGSDGDYMDRFPSSRVGVGLMYVLFWVIAFLRLNTIAKYVLREDTKGWTLPEYPLPAHGKVGSKA